MISFSFFFFPLLLLTFFSPLLCLSCKSITWLIALGFGVLLSGVCQGRKAHVSRLLFLFFSSFFFPFNSLFRHEGTGLSRPDRTGLGAGLGWGPASNGQAHPWVSLLL